MTGLSYFCGYGVLLTFAEKERTMAITVTTPLSGNYLSANVPDVSFTATSGVADVVMTLGGEEIYSETLYSDISGSITLWDLGQLLTDYLRSQLVATLKVSITENGATGTVGHADLTAEIIYCVADLSDNGECATADQFLTSRFLTLLSGPKLTALNRLEYLHYIGTDTASVLARYDDGSTRTFTPPKTQGNARYSTIDVSPSQFAAEGKTLVAFTVDAGARSQTFHLDPQNPDCAPVLLFVNSFGVEELVYCTGLHQVDPSYKRNSTYIKGRMRNYSIEETRTFKADTGVLNVAMAQWLDDLFRSLQVRLVKFVNGEPNVGREVVITDSKSVVTNADDDLPRFTFSYRYAQRNQVVMDLSRAGRIFDNTFDNTFN